MIKRKLKYTMFTLKGMNSLKIKQEQEIVTFCEEK